VKRRLKDLGMHARTSDAPLGTGKKLRASADSVHRRGTAITTTFYINREADKHRRAWIEAELRDANIYGERICGVEGLTVPPALTEYFFDGDRQCSELSPAEVGAYSSHLMAAQIVVERGLEHALVLEDDVVVPLNLSLTLRSVFAHLPPGWDIVHLCGHEPFATKPVTRLEQSRTLVRFSRVPSGAFAYLISRSGAEKFLTPTKRYWPIDTDLRQPWRFGLQIYGVVPALVDHSGRFPSTIATGAKGQRSRLRRGLPSPSWHCWTGNPLHTPQGLYFNLKTLGPLWWTRCWLQNAQMRAVRVLRWQGRDANAARCGTFI